MVVSQWRSKSQVAFAKGRQTMPDTSFTDLVANGRAAVSKGDLAAARKHFERARKLRPESVDATYGLATVFYLLRENAAATTLFEEVQRLDPLHAGAAINLGALCNLAGEYEEAITHLRRGIQLDRTRGEGYYNLGIAYRKLGRFELAISAYREACHLSPRMVEAVYNLANVYFEMARYDQAMSYYRRALELNPSFKKASAGLARAEQKIRESKRPLDSGIIVTETRAGDPIETDARLDRVFSAEHDHDVLARFYAESDEARKRCEEWMRTSEKLDAVIRGLAIHLSSDAPAETVDESLRELRSTYNRFRDCGRRFSETLAILGKARDHMVERA